MKLTGLSAALLGCAALVVAAPIRVTIVSKNVEEARAIPKYRIGFAGAPHAVSHSNVEKKDTEHGDMMFHILPVEHPNVDASSPSFAPVPASVPARRPCAGKSVRLSNWFRQVVGMPPIEPSPHGRHVIKFHTVTVPAPQRDSQDVHPHHHRRPHHHFRYHLRKSFGQRLQMALMTLGPWEGRIVAFVLGCGIGVLLRLVWVMAVLAFRAFRRDTVEEDIYEVDEEEEYFLPPPEYTDEKVALVAVQTVVVPEHQE